MSTTPAPMFFPQALTARNLWKKLGASHNLTDKDFEWFEHIKLASHTLRNAATPPMLAEKILLNATELMSEPLAGCFVLSPTPDDGGFILYTPYTGIKKFDSRKTLSETLTKRLNSVAEDDELLAFMALSKRKTIEDASNITLTFQTIDGDVFNDQSTTITQQQQVNDQDILEELKALPTLGSLLDEVLKERLTPHFPGLDQRQARANFYSARVGDQNQADATPRRLINSLSLADAVLLYYRHQRWPSGQSCEFSHPRKSPAPDDQQHWQTAIDTASRKLINLLAQAIEKYWDTESLHGHGLSRRDFLSLAIAEKARADLLLKREAGIITPEQSQDLHSLIKHTKQTFTTVTAETVLLWEYRPNYVQLAGSLMIHAGNAFLYTPIHGLQVLENYDDLKNTLVNKFSVSGHEEELYGLLSLDERQRFLGFGHPSVSGEVISGSIFLKLFKAIIIKQLRNVEYALQVYRRSDGAVDIHALFDKALDVRSMISEQLLKTDVNGRWSTQPVMTGNQQPSLLLTDKAAAFVKTVSEINTLINREFAEQPVATHAFQQVYLASRKPQLAHALSVGIRGEASLRALDATLHERDRGIIDTVLDPDFPERKNRLSLKGFRPDIYSLTLECSGQENLLPLANCLLMTERGGLDTQHSGHAILYTPALGLEVFANVNDAKQEMGRRLLDSRKRTIFLENLTPTQRQFHQRYSLGPFRRIDKHALQEISQSSIEHFLARCEHLRTLEKDEVKQRKALVALSKKMINTNLDRATWISRAIALQQSLPAWLGMAPVKEQQLHIELLEQFLNSVPDDKDYLHGIKPLKDYVQDTLKTLLGNRFPGARLDPDDIEITPDLSLFGLAQTLTDFALSHVSVTQGASFKVSSKTAAALPAGLDQAAAKQLLSSLDINRTYAKLVKDTLSGSSSDATARKLRFAQQLPWQLLQHAHELTLQQHLSDSAFDLIHQVLDMPDAVARAAVEGAHAIVRSLKLIKTGGANAVAAQGLYLIGPGAGQTGPQVLYSPYCSGPIFTEYADDASVVAALNTPGPLQELLIRRLPDNERAVFRNLLKSTVRKVSEITLDADSIGGNLLTQLFDDNVALLTHMLAGRSETGGFFDWETVKQVLSAGINLISGLLPGKLAYARFLWQAYEDYKDSAGALQDHHWKTALRRFIDGTAQMVSLGKLALENQSNTPVTVPSATPPVPTPVSALQWSQVSSTSLSRTQLRPYETHSVQLKDLKKVSGEGTYLDETSKLKYAPIAGKVYAVEKTGAVWRMIKEKQEGPVLLSTSDNSLVVDPDIHTVHYGKALSKMHNKYVVSREAHHALNIEARGIKAIRIMQPDWARQIVQAIDLARFYAFNSLHNLAQGPHLISGTRLNTFLKDFFDVNNVDAQLIKKIKDAIVPVCKALVDPNEDYMNTERFIFGSNKHPNSDLIAFVMNEDASKSVYITEKFFDHQLDWYKSCMKVPFDVDSHSQAATLIHEFAHLYSNAHDFASLEARRPFVDLIAPQTPQGQALKQSQQTFQREALSLATPKDELFARWNSVLSSWVSLDDIPGTANAGKEILKITGCDTMAKARDAFLDPKSANLRIDTILHNADSIAFLVCGMGRQLDPVPVMSGPST